MNAILISSILQPGRWKILGYFNILEGRGLPRAVSPDPRCHAAEPIDEFRARGHLTEEFFDF